LIMKDGVCHAAAAFPSVELSENPPALALLIHVGPHVERLGNAPLGAIARDNVDGRLLHRSERIISDALTVP
jgi:hypothetical protein